MGLPPPGPDPDARPLPAPPGGMDARAALEAVMVPALARPPCVVSFSGGRDSSAVLATAAHVARREGLPLPVAVSIRFPRVEGTDESAWQECVVRHLRLDHWERIAPDELDFVGPVAAGVLRQHGLLWPPNIYFHEPIVRRAVGGSMLTGVDGDAVLGGWRWAPVPCESWRRRARRRRDYLARAAITAAPLGVRRFVGRRHLKPSGWVRQEAWPEVATYLVSVWDLDPRRWDAWLDWLSRRRYLACIRWAMSQLGAVHDAQVVHPLLDPSFLSALGREGGSSGFGDRTAAMRRLFADLLPDPVLSRDSKAYFDRVMWGPYSREFIDAWDGAGVDASLVDADALRREWQKPMPLFTAATLLQSAWLAKTAQ